MSLLNHWISPNLALVAVDTAGFGLVDQRPGEVSKMIPLLHANVVVAGRGHIDYLRSVFAHMHTSPGSHFDAIADGLPTILDSSMAHCLPDATRAGIEDFGRQEILCVGWSNRHGGMWASNCQSGIEGRFDIREIQWSVAPWDDALGAPPEPKDRASLEHIARTQVKFWQGEKSLGGRLLLAELTRDAMRISSVCKL